ncbi:hypothetical protein EAE96_006291 [Botrytis aclada]|nr:hypothetical protein EAE96_006291 [Botrytis aclada]
MNLCISSHQYDQIKKIITIILPSDERSTHQRHPESKRNLSLGENLESLEVLPKTESKRIERHTDDIGDNPKYGLDMTNTKLRDLEGPLKRPSRDRYADDFRNEHTSIEPRPIRTDLDKENMKVLDASLEDDNEEMMRIDEELRRSFDEVLLKSSQMKSNLKWQILAAEELLALRGELRMSSGDLYSDLVRYKQQLDTTQKNLKKFRDLKSTIAP